MFGDEAVRQHKSELQPLLGLHEGQLDRTAAVRGTDGRLSSSLDMTKA